ncbi:aspartate/glutamate racemase family protein [Chloroflexota bacterium]
MIYGYMPSHHQIDTTIFFTEGRSMSGHAIGILLLDAPYTLLPGDTANATTFEFPVLYKIVEGATVERVLAADPSLNELIIMAGKELEKQGVRAISGACGFFGNYQKEVAAALSIPVFLSSLLQIPLICRSFKPDEKVGVITATTKSLSLSLLSACGINDLSTIVSVGFQDLPECRNITFSTGHFNSSKVEHELVRLAKELVKKNPGVKVLLLECANLPTWAWAIQNATKLPVFDISTLINWVYSGIVRRPFAGFV